MALVGGVFPTGGRAEGRLVGADAAAHLAARTVEAHLGHLALDLAHFLGLVLDPAAALALLGFLDHVGTAARIDFLGAFVPIDNATSGAMLSAFHGVLLTGSGYSGR